MQRFFISVKKLKQGAKARRPVSSRTRLSPSQRASVILKRATSDAHKAERTLNDSVIFAKQVARTELKRGEKSIRDAYGLLFMLSQLEKNGSTDNSEQESNSFPNSTKLSLTVGLSVIAFFIYQCVDNLIKPQKGKKILDKDSGEDFELAHVKHMDHFSLAKQSANAGRSNAKKYQFTDKLTGKTEFYYIKETFSRERFLNEIILGAYAHALCGEHWPKLYLIQKDESNDSARYFIASQSVNHGTSETKNLEDWCSELYDDGEKLLLATPPKGLAQAIILKLLMAERDNKLANLVVNGGNSYPAYPIDWESSSTKGARVLPELTAENLLACIIEYNQADASIAKNMHRQDSTLASAENPHRPLTNNHDVLDNAKALLLTGIEHDLASGGVKQLLQQVVNFKESDIERILNHDYADFIKAPEQAHYRELLGKKVKMAAKAALMELSSAEYAVSSNDDVSRPRM